MYQRQTEDVAKIVYGHICTIYRLEVRNSQSEIPPQDVENNSAWDFEFQTDKLLANQSDIVVVDNEDHNFNRCGNLSGQ